ncbi:MAG TPA: adenylate/guanylate cyclase domain-containing protein [Acidimicrobiia bacterium]|nr:adenylate/guanylate cyclase domain-containing protein [Acidimicrobiia bacterium]
MGEPESGYANTSDGRIGYQVVGGGPPDVLATIPPFLPIDLMWDEPRLVRFLNGLSSFSRHIWFDSRGTGSSDPIAPDEGRVIESVVDSMIAVLDELGCERVIVLGANASHPALQFATTHPERTSALVLINPGARERRADDYPEGIPDEAVEGALATVRDRWGTGEILSRLAPSAAGDRRFARWSTRCERLSMPPQRAGRVFRAGFDVDVRHLLGAIRVPTLVATSAGWFGPERSRYVAEHIDGARHLELASADSLFFMGDTGPLLDAIEEFLTGQLPPGQIDRVLATVLFTDVVSSTPQVAGMGDRRFSEVLATHDDLTRTELERFRGQEVRKTGDGFLATFDGPGRAVRCACAIRDAVRAIGIEVRVGLHTGEIELHSDDIGGIAVHIAQRVQAQAQPDEVLVSRTVVDLVGGSGIPFADRGVHALKGVPNPWQLFAVNGVRGSGAGGELAD